MALPHTPLDATTLSPAARKALEPGPLQMMAARGLAPLPRPGELISVLYQLALARDGQIATAARGAAAELPDKVLIGAVADDTVDPRVLDFFAPLVTTRPLLLERLLLNPATAPETVAALARRVDERFVELIATNEQRLLAHPAIIAGMYSNPRARMSTVDRVVELAVREGVRVPQIPAWEELTAAYSGKVRDPNAGKVTAEEADALFAQAARRASEDEDEDQTSDRDEAEEGRELRISEMTVPMKIRLATLGNAFARSVLVRDSIKMVSLAAIKAPGVKDAEALKYAGNNSLSEDVITYIGNRREWTKVYAIKLALVQNPKTSIPAAIRLMPHLREKDLRQLARSKGISTAVSANARKLSNQRQRSK